MRNTPPVSCRRGAFMGMVSEGHAGTEDEGATEDKGDQGE